MATHQSELLDLGYYARLLAETGVPPLRSVREIFEFVFQDPTDERLRALEALWAAARMAAFRSGVGETADQGRDLAAIITAEREWLQTNATI